MRISRQFGSHHLLVFAAVSAVAYLLSQAAVTPSGSACVMPAPPRVFQMAVVTRVVDGDTIEVRSGTRIARVRLIGVDTPESSPSEKARRDVARSGRSIAAIVDMGRRAALFTRSRLDRRTIGLEFDVQRYDRYGRTLAYVWVGPEMFNVVLVREGYAWAVTIPPNVRYSTIFLACEREARVAGRGLWGR